MEKEEIGCTFQEQQVQGEDIVNIYAFSLKTFLTCSRLIHQDGGPILDHHLPDAGFPFRGRLEYFQALKSLNYRASM